MTKWTSVSCKESTGETIQTIWLNRHCPKQKKSIFSPLFFFFLGGGGGGGALDNPSMLKPDEACHTGDVTCIYHSQTAPHTNTLFFSMDQGTGCSQMPGETTTNHPPGIKTPLLASLIDATEFHWWWWWWGVFEGGEGLLLRAWNVQIMLWFIQTFALHIHLIVFCKTFAFFVCALSWQKSPWCNCNGWLGVKIKVPYSWQKGHSKLESWQFNVALHPQRPEGIIHIVS